MIKVYTEEGDYPLCGHTSRTGDVITIEIKRTDGNGGAKISICGDCAIEFYLALEPEIDKYENERDNG